jgi:hypothetical protein
MKKQINIRASAYLAETIERLRSKLGLNQTEIILLAVEKLAAALEAEK